LKYDTTPEVKTGNGVQAPGGSIGSAGPTVWICYSVELVAASSKMMKKEDK